MMIFAELFPPEAPPGLRIWRAVHGGRMWVIVYEPGKPDWPPDYAAKYVGYTATYRPDAGYYRQPRMDSVLGSDITHLPGGPWCTLPDAEAACISANLRLAFGLHV